MLCIKKQNNIRVLSEIFKGKGGFFGLILYPLIDSASTKAKTETNPAFAQWLTFTGNPFGGFDSIRSAGIIRAVFQERNGLTFDALLYRTQQKRRLEPFRALLLGFCSKDEKGNTGRGLPALVLEYSKNNLSVLPPFKVDRRSIKAMKVQRILNRGWTFMAFSVCLPLYIHVELKIEKGEEENEKKLLAAMGRCCAAWLSMSGSPGIGGTKRERGSGYGRNYGNRNKNKRGPGVVSGHSLQREP
ncbi:hypothetical protein [Desulfospira joergensenii]|uniref:hypothetical protein n=1 Tax=Desulfospira joergensenii TaxID=53329 RepID=UPI000414EBD6|nr:hypothetical protein [Desulfospira joergensenii]